MQGALPPPTLRDHNLLNTCPKGSTPGSGESSHRALQVARIAWANLGFQTVLYGHLVAPSFRSMVAKFGGKWPRHDGVMAGQSLVAGAGGANVFIVHHMSWPGSL